jgi:hypothetical protein
VVPIPFTIETGAPAVFSKTVLQLVIPIAVVAVGIVGSAEQKATL